MAAHPTRVALMRLIRRVTWLSLSVLALFAACTDDTTTSPGAKPDAGLTPSGSDASVPVDAAVAQDAVAPEAASDVAPSTPDAAPDVAPATTILPFATGLGTNGVTLANQQIDPHWTVKDSLGNPLTAYVQTDALGYVGYWMPPTTTSKFISPFIDTVDPAPSGGTFTYTTTFSLKAGLADAGAPDASGDAGTADAADAGPQALTLVIRCAADNQVGSVKVNGQTLPGVVAGSYSAFQTLTFTGPFVTGVNTVEIDVVNTGGPTGLRAELDLLVP